MRNAMYASDEASPALVHRQMFSGQEPSRRSWHSLALSLFLHAGVIAWAVSTIGATAGLPGGARSVSLSFMALTSPQMLIELSAPEPIPEPIPESVPEPLQVPELTELKAELALAPEPVEPLLEPEPAPEPEVATIV